MKSVAGVRGVSHQVLSALEIGKVETLVAVGLSISRSTQARFSLPAKCKVYSCKGPKQSDPKEKADEPEQSVQGVTSVPHQTIHIVFVVGS